MGSCLLHTPMWGKCYVCNEPAQVDDMNMCDDCSDEVFGEADDDEE